MSSLPSIDALVETARASVGHLQVRIESNKASTSHTVSLFEPDVDYEGDDLMFAEITADQHGEVEYPSAEQSEKSAFKITLSNGESTLREISLECGQGVRVNVSIDIEHLCFERILDRLKQLLPADAVLFRQVVGYGIDPIYEHLGFTIKPHVFADGQSRPRCSMKNVTLALADWRSSPKVGDKRTPEEDHTSSSASKKAKSDSA